MFEILEHTADIGFRASAETAEGLFEAAALALVNIAMNVEDVKPRESIEIAVRGDSIESLLVNWLSEVLYCIDGEGLALSQFKVDELTKNRVAGKATGERRDVSRHEPRLVVKGVTYHQLKVEHDDRGWSCEVYLDI